VLKRIKHNLGYKITAIVLAILFWFVVYNNNNPIEVLKLTVPITITNQVYLQLNHLKILNDYDNTVIIEIRGRRSEIKKVNASDFFIKYDLSQITNEDIERIQYDELKYYGANAIYYEVINDGYILVDVESIGIKEKNIEIQLDGEPAYGYSIVGTTLTPEKFTIKEIESLVERIAIAFVKVNIDGIAGNTSVRKACEFYDYNGDLIPELNDYLDVDISIEVAKQLDVESAIIGLANMDYQVVAHNPYPTKIKISGPEQALKNIDILKTEAISVNGKTENFTKSAKFTNLPVGCKVVGGINTIDVNVKIEQLVMKTYTFNKNEISFEYMDSSGQYSYFLLEDKVDIVLKGRQIVLDQITKDMIAPSINVAEKKDSQTFLPVVIILPENTKQISYPTAEVKILRNINLTLKVEDIYIANTRYELYNYIFDNNEISIQVSGFSEDLESIDMNKLNPYIDVKDLKKGKQEVVLNVTLPSGIETSEQLKININIEEK